MQITKNSVVLYRHEDITDIGAISRIEGDEYWSAWANHYYDDSFCDLESLTLIGPPILGVFNDEGN